jgi:hypothetical protein
MGHALPGLRKKLLSLAGRVIDKKQRALFYLLHLGQLEIKEHSTLRTEICQHFNIAGFLNINIKT